MVEWSGYKLKHLQQTCIVLTTEENIKNNVKCCQSLFFHRTWKPVFQTIVCWVKIQQKKKNIRNAFCKKIQKTKRYKPRHITQFWNPLFGLLEQIAIFGSIEWIFDYDDFRLISGISLIYNKVSSSWLNIISFLIHLLKSAIKICQLVKVLSILHFQTKDSLNNEYRCTIRCTILYKYVNIVLGNIVEMIGFVSWKN